MTTLFMPEVAQPSSRPAIAAAAHGDLHSRSPTLEVSVVVPTYRRPAMLERCLAALAEQDIDPHLYEIIVCDDGPDDATRDTVERLKHMHSRRGLAIRYLPVTGTQGPAGARNRGWQAGAGTIIAFTDDDTIADPSWLRHGLDVMEPDTAAATGTIEVPLPRHPTDYERDAAGLAHAEFATANCFVRRTVLKAVGGFDERFEAAWREDSDLQFAIIETGGRIVRVPAAIVAHPVRPARWGVSVSQQKKSQYDALLFKKHRKLFAIRIRQRPPWRYYLIVLALSGGVVALATGNGTPGSGLLLAWLLLTAWFCTERLAHTAHTVTHMLEMIWTSILIPPLSIFWRLYGAVRFRVFFI